MPDGNWTSNVVSGLGNNALDVLNFVPNVDSTTDPAVGCPKNFTGTYKCGLSTTAKSVSLTPEANGKTARFDCSAEFAKCNDLKLTLTDDGKLTLTNGDGTKKLWDSVTAFGANGAFPANAGADNASITVQEYAGDGTPNSKVDVGNGGGAGRRYPHNYLLSGQFLEKDQWIGSPTGTCRLMMGTKDAPNSLQVVKSVPNCDELDMATPMTTTLAATRYTDLGCWNDRGDRALNRYHGYNNTVESCYQLAKTNGSAVFALQDGGQCFTSTQGDNYQKHGRATGTCNELGGAWVNHVYQVNPDVTTTVNSNPDAARLYTIPVLYNEHIGKAGYVNNFGQLQIFPDTMTTYGNTYDQIGSYNSVGGIIKSFTGSNIDECRTKCTTGSFEGGGNDTQKCAGFVFDTTAARCNLLDKTFGQQQRIISPTALYNVRQKSIRGQDVSCPADITVQTADYWEEREKSETPMSAAVKCGLANDTINERAAVASAAPSLISPLQYKDAEGNASASITYEQVKANPALLEKNRNTFKFMFEKLQDKYNTLTGNLFSTKNSIHSKMDELSDSKKNLADWTGEQLQNLTAMNEDRDLNTMSQNYRHILWSILAIIIIIGTIKMTKANAA